MAIRPDLKRAVPKTKNTAKDYNDNFDKMMDYVDATLTECEDYVDAYMPSQTGQGGKVLSTNGTEASWIGLGVNFPFSKYIDGLVITKENSNTIAVDKGSCYDQTGNILLSLNSKTTKQNETQSANTTYYVFIIGTGSAIDIFIGLSSQNPTLPSGYVYYRLIGSYTTDSEGKINKIASYGIDSAADHNGSLVFLPDYTAGVSVEVSTTNVSKTISEPMCVEYVCSGTNTARRFYIDDVIHIGIGYQFGLGFVYQKYLEPGTYQFKTSSVSADQSITLYPLKGV